MPTRWRSTPTAGFLRSGKLRWGGSAVSNYNAILVRYSANGQIDTSFGTGGKVWLDIGGAQDIFKSVALQSNGKIAVTGEGRFAGQTADILMARYNIDGTIDTSFGSGRLGDEGYVRTI